MVLLFQVVEVFLCGVVHFFALSSGDLIWGSCDAVTDITTLYFPSLTATKLTSSDCLVGSKTSGKNSWEKIKIIKGYRTYTISTYKPILAFLNSPIWGLFHWLLNTLFVCGVFIYVYVQIFMGTHVWGPVQVCAYVCGIHGST